MPKIHNIRIETHPPENFHRLAPDYSLIAEGLVPLVQDANLGDIVWICIAYNVRRENKSWAKVGAEILVSLDPHLNSHKSKIESRIRMTFGDLENLELATWRLGEDLLDAEVPLSIELQEMLLREPSELACRAVEIFECNTGSEQVDRSIDILKELPRLKPLEVILPKSFRPVLYRVDIESKPDYSIDAVNKAEQLTGFTIDQIWEQFHKTRDDYFRNLLMEHYRNLVKYCAERLHSKLPDKVEVDDLVSAGIFGLIDAIDAFDPDRGVKFETYCSPRIRGSILDELRSMDWVPRLIRARAHQLAKATHSLETHLGHKPTEKEIAEELDMDTEEFNRLRRDANAVSLVSLNTKYSDGVDKKDICEIDIIKDERSKNPVIEAQKRDLKSLLTKGLTRAERLFVVLYYYEEMTMKEIGATLDLSESRVSQMHSSIIARLKARMNTKKNELVRIINGEKESEYPREHDLAVQEAVLKASEAPMK